MVPRVLLLAPSVGLGGGIERYVAAIEAAFVAEQVRHTRLDLLAGQERSTLRHKAQFTRRVLSHIRRADEPVWVILAHRNLLPLILFAGRLRNFAGASVILHGCELWSRKRHAGRWLLHRPGLRVVAVSNFSAGRMMPACRAAVLSPGLTKDWYDVLVEAGNTARGDRDRIDVVTSFRLRDWRSKGLPTVLTAVSLLGDERVHVTVCGSGPAPDELRELIAATPSCILLADLADGALAEQFASADVFVLATRTESGTDASGEGFGLVLLEAQLAGTPVIAPAFGGSGDAFQPGLTGVAPVDESAQSLAEVLATLVNDEPLRRQMSVAAATWSRARFAPDIHSRQVVQTLVGTTR